MITINDLEKAKYLLDKNGYCVVSNVFSDDDLAKYRASFDRVVDRAVSENQVILNYEDNVLVKGDLAGQEEFKEFDYFIFNKKVASIAKALIGSDPIYFGESNMQSGVGDRGFHSDNRKQDREAPEGQDWKGDYNLIRIAIYLHPSDKCSGGLKVVPGSHKKPTSRFLFGHKNVNAKAGDIVVWKLTTTHSGNAKSIKRLNWLSVHPSFESLIPNWLEQKSLYCRQSLFIVYAGAGDHFNRYLKYFNSREDYTEYQKYSGNRKYLDDMAKKSGVIRLIPSEDFGLYTSEESDV